MRIHIPYFRPFMRETNPGDLPSCCPIVQDFHDVSRTTGLVLSVLRDFGTASSAAVTAVIDLDLFQNRMLTQTCQEKKKVPGFRLVGKGWKGWISHVQHSLYRFYRWASCSTYLILHSVLGWRSALAGNVYGTVLTCFIGSIKFANIVSHVTTLSHDPLYQASIHS